jgi:hypothetical protein
MAFTREWLLMTYTSTFLAFEILAEEYGGGEVDYLQQITRSKTGTLLRIKGGDKRRFAGFLVLNSTASGSITYDAQAYTKGQPSDFIACMAQDTLQVKSFEDTSFWYGVITSNYNPRVVYDLLGKTRITELMIEER